MIAGRTDGYLDFIEICYTPVLTTSPIEGAAPQYKGHRRIRSFGKRVSWREMDIHCNVLQSMKAHQTSIGLLAVASMCLCDIYLHTSLSISKTRAATIQ